MNTTLNCRLLRQQAEQAVEDFPPLRDNLGYQVLSDGKTCEMDPVATQDARIDLYQAWAAYEQSALNERAANWPLFYTFFQEAPIRGILLYNKLCDVTIEGTAHLLRQVRDEKFAELGKGMVEGVGNAFIHALPHLWDAVHASIAYPELSNEALVERWAMPILDLETALGAYEAAGVLAKVPGAIKAGAGAYADAIKGAADAVRNNLDHNGGMIPVMGNVPLAVQAAAVFPAEAEIFTLPILLMSVSSGNGGRRPTNTDPRWPARRFPETQHVSVDEIIGDLARDVGVEPPSSTQHALVVERDTLVSGQPEGMMSDAEFQAAQEVYGRAQAAADEPLTSSPMKMWDDSVGADGSPLTAPPATPAAAPTPAPVRIPNFPVPPQQVVRPQPGFLSDSYQVPFIGPLPKPVVWLGFPGAALLGGAAAYLVGAKESEKKE